MKVTELHSGSTKALNGDSATRRYIDRLRKRVSELQRSGFKDRDVRIEVIEDVIGQLETGAISVDDGKAQLELASSGFSSDMCFPLETLPPGFRAYAEAVATGTLTDTTAAGTAVLGGVSAVVGTRIQVRISESWCYHCGLYVALLAPSSYGKSSVIEAVDQPVRTLEAKLRAETAAEVAKNRETLVYVEAQIKAKKTLLSSALKKGEAADDLPKQIADLEIEAEEVKAKATAPALVADDFTVEAVTDLLELNGERVTVTSGDTGIFNIQRYSDNPSIELLLKCWKGEPHREIRRGRDKDADLQKPSMAMLVATQVENVKTLAVKHPGLVTRGLLPRFLPVIPEDTIGFRDVGKAILEGRGIPKTLQARFNAKLVDLVKQLQKNEGGGVVLSLDNDARQAFTDTCQGYENRQRPGGDLRPILEAAGKLPLQLQKLIGINWAMRACEGDGAVIVTAEIVSDAAAQLDYFIEQQHKLYDAISQAPADAVADKIRRWCDHHPGVTMTAYQLRKSTARHAPKSLFNEALDTVQDEGIVSVATVPTGGRPTEKVTVL